MKSRDRSARRRSWVVVRVAAVVVGAWVGLGAMPDEAERLLASDLARAGESKPAASRALAFDWYRNSPRAAEVYRPLIDHPERKVREHAAEILAAHGPRGAESIAFTSPTLPRLLDESALSLGLVEVQP